MKPLRILSFFILNASLLSANAQSFTAQAREFECGQMIYMTPATITISLTALSNSLEYGGYPPFGGRCHSCPVLEYNKPQWNA